MSDEFLKKHVVSILLILLCVFHLAVNIYYWTQEDIPPSYDCAYHLEISMEMSNIIKHPTSTFISDIFDTTPYYPPLPYIVTAIFFTLFGISPDIAYLSLMVWFFLVIYSTYLCGIILFDNKWAGVLAAFIVSCYPIVFGLTRLYYPDLSVLGTVSFTLACFLKSNLFTNRKWTILFGIAAGLAQTAKWTAIFFWLGIFTAYIIPKLLLSSNDDKNSEHYKTINIFLSGYIILFIIFAYMLNYFFNLMGMFHNYIPKLIIATFIYHIFVLIALILLYRTEKAKELFSNLRNLKWKTRINNLILAIIVMGIISLPWYIHHGSYLISQTSSVATDVAVDRNAPSIGSLKSLAAYLFFLENHQIHLFFFILFIISFLFSDKKTKRIQFALLFGIVVGYLAMTCVRLKDPRYTMPFLYLVSLVTAGGICSFKNKIIKMIFVIIAVAFGIFQYLMITTGFGLDPWARIIHTSYGDIVIFKSWGYGSHGDMNQNWHVKDILDKIALEKEPGQAARVYTLVNHHSIHYEVFNFYSKIKDLSILTKYPPVDSNGIDMNAALSDADFLIIKRGGYLGPEFSIIGLQSALDSLLKTDNIFGFEKVCSYPLPDNSTIELWKKENNFEGDALYDFGGLCKIYSYELKSSSVKKGDKTYLNVVMRVTPEIINNYMFFIHLYTQPDNKFLGAFDNPFNKKNRLGIANIQFVIDTSRAEGTGLGQIAVGFYDPVTWKRLPIKEISTGKDIGDIIYLDAFLEVNE